MSLFPTQLPAGGPRPLPATQARPLAEALAAKAGWTRAYPASVLARQGAWVAAGREGRAPRIAVGFPSAARPAWTNAIRGRELAVDGTTLVLAEADHAAILAFQAALPHLRARSSGGCASVGFGDRTGLASPGHLRSLGRSGFFPVLAQQSVREMTRTQRSADDVMDAAVFGVLQAGWTAGFGADADHLKTAEDIERCARAGFVMFTLDAADCIEEKAAGLSDADLDAAFRKALAEVPGAADWPRRYEGRVFRPARGLSLKLEGRAFREAVVKYARAIARWAELEKAARKATRGRDCEIEVSGDETSVPTTLEEHFFIVHELQERGVRLDSLAPRFIGDFEKGVDYIGDLAAFSRSLDRHALLARTLGGYKISVHSGSDKFSLYPAVARATRGRFHLKTAGTSWLEALRAVARRDVPLFRELVDLSRERFAQDSASYFISGRPEHVPAPKDLKDADLERHYLDGNAGRQVLHVTYGSVLGRFRDRILDLLAREEETYFQCLDAHLGRHVKGLRAKKAPASRRLAAAGVRS
jgi:hypothetical protein